MVFITSFICNAQNVSFNVTITNTTDFTIKANQLFMSKTIDTTEYFISKTNDINVLKPINDFKYRIDIPYHSVYLITIYDSITSTTKEMYISAGPPIANANPFELTCDFVTDNSITIRYNPETKIYEYLLLKNN